VQLRLNAQKLRKALRSVDEEDQDAGLEIRTWFGLNNTVKNSTIMTIDFEVIPRKLGELLAVALVDECDLNPNQRLKLAGYVAKETKFLTFDDKYFATAKELYNFLKPLKSSKSAANVAVLLGSRRYPAHAQVTYHTHEDYSFVSLRVSFNVGQYPYVETFVMGGSFLSVPVGELSQEEKEDPICLADWMRSKKIVELTPQILEEATGKLEKMERLKPRIQMVCTGQCLEVVRSFWGASLQESKFGSFLHPERVIFDTEFEQDGDEDDYYGRKELHYPFTPLVRIFSLRMKKYVLVDVGDLDDYVFDKTAINRLVLPEKTRSLLTNIFNHKEETFGDVIAGKHGGMVIMASGTTGVGKTLTAEVLAEYTERPLYVMELGELGTQLASVENCLNNIFKRVTRWNALLLFDEADIFLHKRDDNLERSAIVGVFLRLLDYFPGIMFLTTNRGEIIDPAILSRVTIKLDYPDLDDTARDRIWHVMFKLVGQAIEITGTLPKLKINGRQIRNLMRLGVSMYGKQVTAEQIESLSEFTAK
jgi:hypothetical protein